MLTGDAFSTDGDVAWIRQSASDGRVVELGLCGGKALRFGDVSLDRATAGNAKARNTPNGWVSDGGDVRVLRDTTASGAAAHLR